MRNEKSIFREVELLQAGSTCETAHERIIRETALTVRVNGETYATAMLLAENEKEYAAGLLYAQGCIGARDILSIGLKGNQVDVQVKPNGISPLEGPVASSLNVHRKYIFACVRAILKSPVFIETEAVHSAGLFREGQEPAAIFEDIGRHQAFDKSIGAALLNGEDFSKLVAASTGRLPVEMILRCRNAGIPIIATKGVPTAAAITLAEESNITIAGLVRGDSMLIYSHGERIG